MSESAAAPSTDQIFLRDVSADDAEFLYRVYASTREQELALTNWSDEQKAQFCLMQFNAQTTEYLANYPHARHSVIERNGTAVGRRDVLERGAREIRVIDIALLPEACGAGIGTDLLRELMAEAAGLGKALTIHVEKFNPALRLYLRIGFRAIEDKGVQFARWSNMRRMLPVPQDRPTQLKIASNFDVSAFPAMGTTKISKAPSVACSRR